MTAIRVVAFDPDGRAVHLAPREWICDLNLKRLTCKLINGKALAKYDLSADILALVAEDGREETAWGETLGRIALTGLATGITFKGKSLSGAMFDLAIRGTEKRSLNNVTIVFRDSTIIWFEASEEVLRELKSRLPSHVFGTNAKSNAIKLLDTISRMRRDGARVLDELSDSIQSKEVCIQDFKKLSETASTFAERDNARQEVTNFENQITDARDVIRSVRWELAAEQPNAARNKDEAQYQRPTIGSFIVLCLFTFTVIFLVLMSVGIFAFPKGGLGAMLIAWTALILPLAVIGWMIKRRKLPK